MNQFLRNFIQDSCTQNEAKDNSLGKLRSPAQGIIDSQESRLGDAFNIIRIDNNYEIIDLQIDQLIEIMENYMEKLDAQSFD